MKTNAIKVFLFVYFLAALLINAAQVKADNEASISDIAIDNKGILYFTDKVHGKIVFKMADGETGVLVSGLEQPSLVTVDLRRNVYAYLPFQGDIVRVSPKGVVTTIVTGIKDVRAISVDQDENIYILRDADQIQKISHP